jgi:Flp pilus assembly protein TadB
LLRRFVDDPSWLLFSLAVAIPGTALGVLIWGIVGLATSPPVTVVSVILTIALALWVLHKLRRGRSHQCQGLHCPGCRGDQ